MNKAWLLSLGALVLLLSPGRGDELPPDARRIIEKADKDVNHLEQRAEEIARKAQEEVLKARVAAEQRRQKMIADLQALHDFLDKQGKFPQAKAIAVVLEDLKTPPQADPGSPGGFRGQNGKAFRFLVTGNANAGTVWGTGIYTDDSPIAQAAVHAGLLKSGERGVVKVTILPGQASYQGSTRNGVTTSPYNAWGGSYRIELVRKLPPAPAVPVLPR
jgi:LCCL domain